MAVLQRLRNLVGGKREKRERPTTGELGWGGAKVFGGIVQEEYNPDLKGRLALQTAEKMRRTSGQVRALEQVIRLPIQSTQWAVEEPRSAGSAEREAAELLRENLFGGMERSWSDVMREACLAIYFGFRVPEIVWEEQKGLVVVRDLASRTRSCWSGGSTTSGDGWSGSSTPETGLSARAWRTRAGAPGTSGSLSRWRRWSTSSTTGRTATRRGSGCGGASIRTGSSILPLPFRRDPARRHVETTAPRQGPRADGTRG